MPPKPPLIVSEPPLEPFEHLQGIKSRPIPPKGLESILRVKQILQILLNICNFLKKLTNAIQDSLEVRKEPAIALQYAISCPGPREESSRTLSRPCPSLDPVQPTHTVDIQEALIVDGLFWALRDIQNFLRILSS